MRIVPAFECSNWRLFNDVEMTRQLQPTRYAIFTLIDSMMKKQRKGFFPYGAAGLMSSIKETGETLHRRIYRINDKRERSTQSYAGILNSKSNSHRIRHRHSPRSNFPDFLYQTDVRNSLTQYSVISQSPSKHDQMTFTASRQTT